MFEVSRTYDTQNSCVLQVWDNPLLYNFCRGRKPSLTCLFYHLVYLYRVSQWALNNWRTQKRELIFGDVFWHGLIPLLIKKLCFCVYRWDPEPWEILYKHPVFVPELISRNDQNFLLSQTRFVSWFRLTLPLSRKLIYRRYL